MTHSQRMPFAKATNACWPLCRQASYWVRDSIGESDGETCVPRRSDKWLLSVFRSSHPATGSHPLLDVANNRSRSHLVPPGLPTKKLQKTLSVDLPVQLARRFIYPEFLKLTRQGFVAHPARPHRVDQSLLCHLLPFNANYLHGCSLRWSEGMSGLGVGPLNLEFCQISVVYDLFVEISEWGELFDHLGLPPKGRELVLRARVTADVPAQLLAGVQGCLAYSVMCSCVWR